MLPLSERRSDHFRAHERRPLELDAVLWRPGGAEPMAAKVLNLGLGGAGFACAAILRPEERLTVTLISPSLLDPLVAPARVAWIRPAEDAALLYGGLTFEAVDRGVLLTLFQLIGGVTP